MINNNLGWNAGARSVRVEAGNCVASFKPTEKATGVVVGFNTVDRDVGFSEILHGIYFRRASNLQLFSAFESGVQQGTTTTYAEGDAFQITRSEGIVSYWQNGVVFYVSAVPSTQIVFLDTSLYAAGDGVL